MEQQAFLFYEQLTELARYRAQEVAFLSRQGALTFGEYKRQVNRLAFGLNQSGWVQGDRLLLLLDNCLEFMVCYGACAQLGVIAVPLNTRTSSEEMILVAKNTLPKGIIFGSNYSEMADEVIAAGDIKNSFGLGEGENSYESLISLGLTEACAKLEVKSPFVIIPTAATDGVPKGATLSYQNLRAAASYQISEFGRDKVSSLLCFLPLFHILGLSGVMTTFLLGGKTVLMEKFEAEAAVDWVDQEQLAYTLTFPPILGSILDAAKAKNSRMESLKLVYGIEGTPMIERLSQETNADFWIGFGQAETTGFVICADAIKHTGSAGIFNYFNKVDIVDETGRLGSIGEEGEIVVQGPLVFLGYWERPEANIWVSRGGVHHTGDKGRFDESGRLYYLGRLPEKELIKTGGENVYPKEVEEILIKHPMITQAMVFGIPDEKWGEAIVALVEVNDGKKLSLDEVRFFVGDEIAGFKRPKHLQVVEKLPTKGGVVDREAAKKLFVAK